MTLRSDGTIYGVEEHWERTDLEWEKKKELSLELLGVRCLTNIQVQIGKEHCNRCIWLLQRGWDQKVIWELLAHLGRRQWHSTPLLLSGKSHGWRSLLGCSPWGHGESDMTERLHFHFSLSFIGEGNGNPLQCSCLVNPRAGGAWWAAVYGVTQSRTQLKRLSSSSSSSSSREWVTIKLQEPNSGYSERSERWGTSLAVQWLKLHASIARGTGLTPGWRTKSPHAIWYSQKKKKKHQREREKLNKGYQEKIESTQTTTKCGIMSVRRRKIF